jgi:mannose-6-phosphate isomerase-like protein (cupin superfamily)
VPFTILEVLIGARVIILKGRDKFIVEDMEVAVEPSTAIYMPKNSLHQLRAEEDVEAIWLAWQTPP